MRLDDAQMLKVLEHPGRPPFNRLGFVMPLARMRALYQYDESPEALGKCREQMNALLAGHGGAYRDEYNWMVSL